MGILYKDKYTTLGNPWWYWRTQSGFKSETPLERGSDHNYSVRVMYARSSSASGPPDRIDAWCAPKNEHLNPSLKVALALNAAYSKIQSRMDQSELGATLFAEGASALKMIHDRTRSLTRSWSACKKGRYSEAWRSLTGQYLTKKQKKDLVERGRKLLVRQTGRLPAAISGYTVAKLQRRLPFAIWLEMHFGWLPLITDINQSIQILDSGKLGIGDVYRFRGRESWSHEAINTTVPKAVWVARTLRWAGVCGQTVRVRVSSPNAYLWSRLGLTNLSGIVWEAIPFSWFADYFANIGDFLSSFDDWIGLDIISSSRWEKKTVDGHEWRRVLQPDGSRKAEHRQSRFVSFSRTVQPKPTITLVRYPPSMWFNFNRAMNVTSVAVTRFAPHL